MLTDNNRKVTIIAYYFSKFDRDAMRQLGYSSLKEAFNDLSHKFGKDNGYLKLRRDEFDPLTGSHRVGFNKRIPKTIVETFHNGLCRYSFEELTEIVKELLIDDNELYIPEKEIIEAKKFIINYSEEEIEMIINSQDINSRINEGNKIVKNRIFNPKIQNALKSLYKYRCQICGARAKEIYGVDVTEAHHLQYFSKTANNNANNIIVVCPDHHRIIHKATPIFINERKCFEYNNGRKEILMYNIHL